MPRYDYECTHCEAVIEIEHSIKDPAVEHRPHWPHGFQQEGDALNAKEGQVFCDGKLKRLVGKPMFNFKGGSPTPKFHS